MTRKWMNYTGIFQLLISLIFITALLHHNIDSKFGIINDHDIIISLGNDQSMSFNEIPPLVMKREAGNPGATVRYRPAYFPLYFTEMALWGGNPRPWYVFRIVLFGFTLAIAWNLLGKALGALGGGFACVAMLSHSCWNEMFSTLGPSETYIAPALAIYCLAYSKLWAATERESGRWWLLLALGAGVAMGCKENFTLLLFPTAILTYRAFASRSLGIAGILSSTFVMLFGTFIVGAVSIALRNKGVDVYCNSVSPVSRLSLVVSFFSKFEYVLLPFIVTSLLVVAEKYLVFNRLREKPHICFKMITYQFICLLGLITNFIFYNGHWPTYNRYDFPGVIFSDISWIMMVYCLVKFVSSQLLGLKETRVNSFRTACYTGILLIFLYSKGWNEVKGLNSGSMSYSIATNKFQNVLMRTIEIAKQDDQAPIIFVTHSVMDYERIYSVLTYMRTFGVKNKFGIRIDGSAYSSPSTPLENQLARQIMTLSEEGTKHKGGRLNYLNISPLKEVTQNCPCTILDINLY